MPNKAAEMIKKGQKFAKFLPNGWRLLGVDPGYLFVTDPRGSLDLPEDVVDALLKRLK